jgi:hypothetical protein
MIWERIPNDDKEEEEEEEAKRHQTVRTGWRCMHPICA